MGASKHFSTQNGRALCTNQLFAAPTFCRENVYFARMFDFYLFLSMSLACMLRPWSPKKASFCKNLLLCHFPAIFSIVFKEQPILFVRKWAQCYLQPVFFTMLTKSEAFIIVHTPSIPSSFAQELCWKARLTRTSGMALHFEIFVISCIDAAWHATPWWKQQQSCNYLLKSQNATPCHLSVSAWLFNTTLEWTLHFVSTLLKDRPQK